MARRRRHSPHRRSTSSRPFSGWGLNIGIGAALVVSGLLLYAFVTANLPVDLDPLRASAPTTSSGQAFQVEIRNGCGVAGVGREATLFLRDRGFDVVETGNFDDFSQARTRIVDRVGNRDAARGLARVLGVAEDQIEEDISPEMLLDVTVILGHDYSSLAPFKSREPR